MSSPVPEETRRRPQHVAIIMDGNGRWAQQRGLMRNAGHRQGVENVRTIVKAARAADISFLTLYAFSVENWKRPRLEVEALMRLLELFLREQEQELIRSETRLRVLGRVDELPRAVGRLLERVLEATAHFTQWNLSLALNYGSRTEVVDAVRAMLQATREGRLDPAQVDWSTISSHLYTADLPDPDLVIRTSGENRVSNFLLLQSAYAEYYFTPKHWPDFGPDDLTAALEAYARRERRFGCTGEQVRTTAAAT